MVSKLILIDTSFQKHYLREINSGFAEMLKHGLIFENYYKTLSELKNIDSKLSTELIYNSIKIKNEVVNRFKRKNFRKI